MNKLNRVRRVLSALNGATIPPLNELDQEFLKFLELTLIPNTQNNYEFYQRLKLTNPTMTIELLSELYLNTHSQETLMPEAVVTTPKIEIKGLGMELLRKDSAGMHTISESLNKKYKKNETIANVGAGISTAFLSVGSVIGAQLSANDSNLTKAATLLYNATTDVVEKMGVAGKVVGTALKNAAIAGDIMQSMGGGTDQMTTTDKWMDSPFLSWNVGAINGFGGLRADTFAVDQNTLENVGSSYGGTSTEIMDAASKSGKKYGLFSSGARKRDNRAMAAARAKQNIMADISDEATDQRLAVLSMGELAGLAYSLMTDGGYNLKYTYAAKHGGTLEWNPEITLEWEPKIELNWELPAFKEGGQISEELEWVPELQEGGKTRTLEEYPQEYIVFKNSLPDNLKNTPESEYRTYLYWQLWGKPKDFKYTLEHPNEDGEYMYNWDESDKSYHGSSVAWGKDGIGYFIKPKHHSTLKYELDWFNKGIITEEGGKQREMTPEERKEWENFKNNYVLVDDGNFYKYVPKNQSNNYKDVYDFYKDYDLSGINIIKGDLAKTEGNNIHITNDEDLVHELWHYLSQNKPNEIYKEFYDNLNDLRILELGGDLQFVNRLGDPGVFYHPSELEARIKAAKYKTKGYKYTKDFFKELRKNPEKYGYNMRDLLYMYNDENLEKIFSLKLGGLIKESDILEILETTQKNVIPEGALHKNKHHMEHAEGLTKKGIPVIDEEGELQAEIELNEIIFTLEVTKKLEEYYEVFYSEDSTNKEKELAALEAGKLLVYEILENTDDRTGLIESCKLGGSLTLKKSTDDLIEEALEWIPNIIIIEETIEKAIEEKPKKENKEKTEKELMKEAIKEVLIELLTK